MMRIGWRQVIIVLLCGAALAAAAIYGVVVLELRRQQPEIAAMNAKAETLKRDVQRLVPAGTAEDVALRSLQAWADGNPTRIERAWTEDDGPSERLYILSLGRKPSGVWYCGPEQTGVYVRFRQGSAVETQLWGRADDCL